MTTTRRLRAEHLWRADGWLTPGFIEINADGTITRVSASEPTDWAGVSVERLNGFILPGAPNLHSHAHQRGLAGNAEGGAGANEAENFWSWRTRMYDFALRLSPDDLGAIAEQAYIEMLKAGFTTVGEFHYLHHDPVGRAYSNPAQLSEELLAAADSTGIAITLLPALYTRGGIGQPPSDDQRRFVHRDVDAFSLLIGRLRRVIERRPLMRVGVAPHSVRAVSVDELRALPDAFPDGPVHIHVAEQEREVVECLERLGEPPARWLLDNVPVDERWTFIHATHCRGDELADIAARGVVVGLCPLTEANLGDGVFPLLEYARVGGAWGIGTDSNIAISATAELQCLEYGQRLTRRRRSVLVAPGSPLSEQPGRALFDRAVAGGAKSLAQPVGAIAAGLRADLIELDPNHPALAGAGAHAALDRWVFAAATPAVRNVMVGGEWVVRDGHHAREEAALARFRDTVRRLLP